MKFTRQMLQDMDLPWSAIEDKIVEHGRWSVLHKIVFQVGEDEFYQTCYSAGATEYQDERPWENEKEVECVKVKKVQKMVEVWEEVK